ncbi:LysR family transcriptional regulator [Pseudomonas sp. X10]
MDYFAALTAFVEAAQDNNFSRAAERLGIKASTVSRYVKSLEQELGIALFNRSTRMLHLTEGGETFLLHAHRVLEALENAKAATSALNQHPRGVLKLNIPPAFARHHILPALNTFLGRFPEVRVELVLDDSQANLIHSGIDLAIRIGALADSTLMARKIAEEKLLLVVSPAFAAAHAQPASPADLEHLPSGSSIDSWAELVFVSPTQGSFQPILADCIRINDLDAQLIAARQGLGVAILPDWLVAKSIEANELLVWLPEWDIRSVERKSAVWFVYPPKRIVSSKVRCFIDFMVERIGTTPYWQC